MELLSPRDLLECLTWRYATQKFDPSKKIASDTWHALEHSLLLSPSSFGLQPWAFVVVTDHATREKLRHATWNQPQVTDASHFVVFAYRKNIRAADADRLVERIAEVRKVSPESLSGLRQMMAGFLGNPPGGLKIDDWSMRQVYLALGVFLTGCAALGVDACPIDALQPAEYDRILGLARLGLGTVCAAAAGHRADDDVHATLPKVRFPAEQIILRR